MWGGARTASTALIATALGIGVGTTAMAATQPPTAPAQSHSEALAGGWFPLGGPYLESTPEVLPSGDRLVQMDVDGAPYVHLRTNGVWSGPIYVGGLFNSSVVYTVALNEPQPAIAELFGVGLDDAMWYRTSVAGWSSLGGGFLSSPKAVRFGGVTYVFAVGLDGAVWYRTLASGWISLGGYITSDLDVTTDGTSMYVLGRGLDYAMWSRRMTSGAWAPWQSLGGGFLSYPASSFLFDAGYVFAVGFDGAIWQARIQAQSWTGWQSLGGFALSAPAASTDPNGGVDVFVVGGDDAMYQRTLTSAGWSPWVGLGGGFISNPGASGTQVFAIGFDGWLYGATFA